MNKIFFDFAMMAVMTSLSCNQVYSMNKQAMREGLQAYYDNQPVYVHYNPVITTPSGEKFDVQFSVEVSRKNSETHHDMIDNILQHYGDALIAKTLEKMQTDKDNKETSEPSAEGYAPDPYDNKEIQSELRSYLQRHGGSRDNDHAIFQRLSHFFSEAGQSVKNGFRLFIRRYSPHPNATQQPQPSYESLWLATLQTANEQGENFFAQLSKCRTNG